MYCRNCANEVSDKAIACPQCGVNPRSEKKFCPSCGIATSTLQAVCTKCGVSLASPSFSLNAVNLSGIDVDSLKKNPVFICAGVALLCCFFPWLKIEAGVVQVKFSLFSLAHPLRIADTILLPGLLYLFPLCLLGIIVSEFVPKIAKFRKRLIIASLVLMGYALIGFYQLVNPSSSSADLSAIARGMISKGFSIGVGFYASLVATLALAYFSGLLSKK